MTTSKATTKTQVEQRILEALDAAVQQAADKPEDAALHSRVMTFTQAYQAVRDA